MVPSFFLPCHIAWNGTVDAVYVFMFKAVFLVLFLFIYKFIIEVQWFILIMTCILYTSDHVDYDIM